MILFHWKVTLLALDDTALGKEDDEAGVEVGEPETDSATVTITEVKEEDGGTVEDKRPEGAGED